MIISAKLKHVVLAAGAALAAVSLLGIVEYAFSLKILSEYPTYYHFICDLTATLIVIVGYGVFVDSYTKSIRSRHVTKLRRMNKLMEQTERFAEMGSWEWEVASNTVIWSENLYAVFGMDPNHDSPLDREGMNRILDKEEAELHDCAVEKAVTQGIPYRMKLHLNKSKDGVNKILYVESTVEKDASGKTLRLQGMVQDITRKEASEQALLKSEQFLSQTGRLSHVGGWEIDIHSGKANWTQMVSEIYGVEDDPDFEITAERGIKFYPEPGRSSLQQHLNRLVVEGLPYDLKLPFITAKGRHLTVRVIGLAEKKKGKVTRIYGAIQDITKMQKLEDERMNLLSQMEKAQRLESIGLFSGGIAHDFNNVLQVILLNLELAKSQSPGEKVTKILEEIRQSTMTAAEVCDQMLTYAGKTDIQISPVSLNSTIRNIENLLKSSIGHACVLDIDLQADRDIFLGNTSRIKQVIMNLAINSSEACDDDAEEGRIRIKTDIQEMDDELAAELIPPHPRATGPFIHLEISDNGKGMSKEEIQKIFDPFFTTKFHGRGLGLSSVMGIIKSFCGGIRVESQPGKGTRFDVYLPVHEAQAASPHPPTIEPAPEPVKSNDTANTVLIIDDDKSILRGLSVSLEKMNYQPISTDSGEKGLEIFRSKESTISCILLDLTMPGWSGSKTLTEIRKVNKEVPVIIMSGYDIDDSSLKFSRKDISGYMHKPFQLATLLDMLQTVMKEHRSNGPSN